MIAVDDEDDLVGALANLDLDDEGKPKHSLQVESNDYDASVFGNGEPESFHLGSQPTICDF